MANNYTDASISPALPASLFSQAEIELLESACNVVCDRDGEALHLFGELYFSTEGEDEGGCEVNPPALLQSKLRQLDPAAYPHITIHGARIAKESPGRVRRVRLPHHPLRYPFHLDLGMACDAIGRNHRSGRRPAMTQERKSAEPAPASAGDGGRRYQRPLEPPLRPGRR